MAANVDIDSITAFFNYVDSDNDGFVTVSEIQNAMAVDYDNSGTITDDEKVRAGAQWIANGPFAAQDLNGDNKISLQELLAYNNQPDPAAPTQ
jgi:Ca2+-binding EF-hand superfamily protein